MSQEYFSIRGLEISVLPTKEAQSGFTTYWECPSHGVVDMRPCPVCFEVTDLAAALSSAINERGGILLPILSEELQGELLRAGWRSILCGLHRSGPGLEDQRAEKQMAGADPRSKARTRPIPQRQYGIFFSFKDDGVDYKNEGRKTWKTNWQ